MSPSRLQHRLTQDVKLLQKAVIVHQGAVLLLQRDALAASRPLLWDLPGGNSEWPDTSREGTNLHQQDIAREILEETGITIVPEHFSLDALVYFQTYFLEDVFSIIVGWQVELPTDFDRDAIRLSEEHTTHKWVPFDEASTYDFGYGDQFILPMIRQTQQHG